MDRSLQTTLLVLLLLWGVTLCETPSDSGSDTSVIATVDSSTSIVGEDSLQTDYYEEIEGELVTEEDELLPDDGDSVTSDTTLDSDSADLNTSTEEVVDSAVTTDALFAAADSIRAVADSIKKSVDSLRGIADSLESLAYGEESDTLPPVGTIEQKLNLEMTYYLNDFKSDLKYNMRKILQRGVLSQDFNYTVEYDRQTLHRQQHITFDGKALWGKPVQFGLEWLPILYETDYVDQDSGYGVASLALGPVIAGQFFTVPFSVSGGYTFDLWNENLRRDWLETSMENTSFDDGGYFTFQAGSEVKPLIRRTGLFGHGQVQGRYMRGLANSKVTRGDVMVVYKNNSLFSVDSLSVTFMDTLIHGRVESPYEHKSSYLENSVRVDNLTSVGLDVASLGDGFIEPNFSVYLTQSQYRYPFSSGNSSRKARELSTSVGYQKEFSKRFSLAGEFAMTFGNENHLYEKSDKEITTSGTISEKTANLDDAEILSPLFAHSFLYKGKRFLELDYSFSIERDRKRHPYFYSSFGDTVRSSSDYDKQHMTHAATVGFILSPKMKLSLIGDYNRELSYYMSPRASKNSFSRQRYKVELGQQYNFDSTSFFSTALGTYVEPKEFLYKQSTHSRNFYGKLKGTQLFTQRMKLLYDFEGRFYDRGDWFGSTGYGISLKSREVRTDLTGAFFLLPPNPGRKHILALQLVGGFEGAYERTKTWQFDKDRFNKGTNLYKSSPIGGLTMVLMKGFTIKANVQRYFDKVVDIELMELDEASDLPESERYTGDLQKYWDLSLTVTYGG